MSRTASSSSETSTSSIELPPPASLASTLASSAALPLTRVEVELPVGPPTPWLDESIPGVKTFVGMHGTSLGDGPTGRYFTMPSSVAAELRSATNELHGMFVAATKHVLKHPELWPAFGFQETFWSHAVRSFHLGDAAVFGRFDFAVTPQGIKAYEYNSDSASCLLESNVVQSAWSSRVGAPGRCAGAGGEERLIATFRSLQLGPGALLHILHDVDEEERYHALYVQGCAERAGIRCKDVSGVEGLSFDDQGHILDPDGVPIQRLWKTWAYDTILGEWDGGALRRSGTVRLVDLCLRPDIVVYEPLWCAIPANKAILPVLWELYPHHKYLLRSELALSDELRMRGYVAKPVNGRGGGNISIVAGVPSEVRTGSQIASTDGKFESGTIIYQELFALPRFNGNTEHVQLSAFAVGGRYAGAILRSDPTPIVKYASDAVPLRILDDGSGAPLDDDDAAPPSGAGAVSMDLEPTELEVLHSATCGMEEVGGHGRPPLEDTIEDARPSTDPADRRSTRCKGRAGKVAPLGAVLGYAPGKVPCYSSRYDSLSKAARERIAFRHEERVSEDRVIYYGYKYQCVEFARRWLFAAYGHTFKDVGMAYQIFDMKYAVRFEDMKNVPFKSVPNGSKHDRPTRGCLLIWNEGGFFEVTGHVAIVTEATSEWVRVAEQNVDDRFWPPGRDYSRELPVRIRRDGSYHVSAVEAGSKDTGSIRGWMHILFEPHPLRA